MIRAILWRDAGGQYTGYQLEGHAGWADSGEDIVCAAASVLSITCLNALESVAGLVPEVAGGDNGSLRVRLPAKLTDAQRHDAQVLMGFLRQGLHDLSTDYPANVHFSIKERRESP